jgi:hypothetical protein
MTIFGCENAAKRFFFRNLHEKLGKKMLWKIFYLCHIGVKYGVKNGPIQKSTISLKMVQNRQFCEFFIGERPIMMRISTRFLQNRMFDSLILQLTLNMGAVMKPQPIQRS